MRMSFWLPKNKRWIYKALRKVQFLSEEEGVPLSMSNIIIEALSKYLEKYADSEDLPILREEGGSLKRRTITIRKQDSFFIDCLDSIVESKKLSGMKSSFSYELVRLAKNAFFGMFVGKEIDLRMLEKEDVIT